MMSCCRLAKRVILISTKKQLTGLQQAIEKIDPSWSTERRRLPP